jgi:hypothetical protein
MQCLVHVDAVRLYAYPNIDLLIDQLLLIQVHHLWTAVHHCRMALNEIVGCIDLS